MFLNILFVFILMICRCRQQIHGTVTSSSILNHKKMFNYFTARIVNGKKIDITQIPYQVQIEYHNQLNCGGTIVTSRHVISAAHCFLLTTDPEHYTIRAGTTINNHGGHSYEIAAISVHPQFDFTTMDWDVSVIRILDEFDIGKKIQPIELTDKRPLPIGREGIVSGWGRTSYTGLPAHVLMYIYLPIMSHNECQSSYTNKAAQITERMYCAGFSGGKYDACTGDSGGPMILDGQLIGIVSWGINCAKPGLPGVYTYIPTVLDWIREQINVM